MGAMPRLSTALTAIVAVSVSCSALAQGGWPERIVKIEEMRLLTPVHIFVEDLTLKAQVRGPAVLKMHVGAAGDVIQVTLLESTGSPQHDEAAMHTMRKARFQPKLIDGVATPVTLVVPLHMPKMKILTPGR